MKRIVFFLIASLVLSSCHLQEEKNTPSFSIQTVASQLNMRTYSNSIDMSDRTDATVNETVKTEIQRHLMGSDPDEEFNIDLKYTFDSNEFLEGSNKNPDNIIEAIILAFGDLFSSLFLGITGGHQVEIDPILIPVPNQLDLDTDIIKAISIRHIKLESDKTDFTFLKNLQIDFLNHSGGGRSPLLASYTRKIKGDIKELYLGLQKIDLLPYLKPNENLIIKPAIKVDKLPPKLIRFKGTIVFRVTLKLPF